MALTTCYAPRCSVLFCYKVEHSYSLDTQHRTGPGTTKKEGDISSFEINSTPQNLNLDYDFKQSYS